MTLVAGSGPRPSHTLAILYDVLLRPRGRSMRPARRGPRRRGRDRASGRARRPHSPRRERGEGPTHTPTSSRDYCAPAGVTSEPSPSPRGAGGGRRSSLSAMNLSGSARQVRARSPSARWARHESAGNVIDRRFWRWPVPKGQGHPGKIIIGPSARVVPGIPSGRFVIAHVWAEKCEGWRICAAQPSGAGGANWDGAVRI